MKRALKIGLAVTVIGLVVAGGYLAAVMRALPVDTVTAGPADLSVKVSGTGDVVAADPATVYAEAPGKLLSVPVKAGQQVAAGDLLALYDTAELEDARAMALAEKAALEAQQAEVAAQTHLARAIANRELEEARRNLERVEFLFEQDALPQAELDAARRAYDLAALAVEQAEAGELTLAAVGARLGIVAVSLEQAERQLARARVTAPSAGTVLERLVKPGAVVAPGTPLFVIADPGKLEVEAEIEPRDAAQVKAGATARILHLAGGAPVASGEVVRTAAAGVTAVSPLGVREAKARLDIAVVEDADALKPGYQVRLEILVEDIPVEMSVPETALFERAGQTKVFVIRDGRAQETAVETGRRTTRLVEITGEIEPGAKVIVNPPAQVRDGARVESRN